MKYLVAVSGGVDSVVLLDMLTKQKHRLIVAHVDHGIRGDSAADARFVEQLARRYHVPYVGTRVELGAHASEEKAREARYEFLMQQAAVHGATILTAHHQDDMAETVAINLVRGTGWRGLTVLDRQGIQRPLLPLPKAALYDYAMKHRLEWVEDETNASERYQRNRIRHAARANLSADASTAIGKLRSSQLQLRRAIRHETTGLLQQHAGSRHFLTQIDSAVAIELLGSDIEDQVGRRPTRPQLARALHAIKIAAPGTTYQVGGHIELKFTSRKYRVKVV